MSRRRIIGLVVAVSLFLVTSAALAQPWKGWRGSGGWGMGSQYNRMYNPATVETLSGTVESVDKVTPMKGMFYGIHLMVKTDKETIPVDLGPGWYIERLDTKIAPTRWRSSVEPAWLRRAGMAQPNYGTPHSTGSCSLSIPPMQPREPSVRMGCTQRPVLGTAA